MGLVAARDCVGGVLWRLSLVSLVDGVCRDSAIEVSLVSCPDVSVIVGMRAVSQIA